MYLLLHKKYYTIIGLCATKEQVDEECSGRKNIVGVRVSEKMFAHIIDFIEQEKLSKIPQEQIDNAKWLNTIYELSHPELNKKDSSYKKP